MRQKDVQRQLSVVMSAQTFQYVAQFVDRPDGGVLEYNETGLGKEIP